MKKSVYEKPEVKIRYMSKEKIVTTASLLERKELSYLEAGLDLNNQKKLVIATILNYSE